MNSSGKVLIIFLAITAILLVSLTAISLFFFQKETERRKQAEVSFEEMKGEKLKLEEDLKEAKKQNFLLEAKSKEAEERLSDLSDELELEKGLREEIKLALEAVEEKLESVASKKEEFEKEVLAKTDLHDKMAEELSVSQQKISKLEAQLKSEIKRGQKIGKLYEEQQAKVTELEESRAQLEAQAAQRGPLIAQESAVVSDGGVELEEIVVNPQTGTVEETVLDFQLEETLPVLDVDLDGRILSVDRDTEFVIVSLGANHGLSVGNVLSVYRNDNYMGDIKVTRTQPEMSAADLVQPLSIRKVKKNDQVKAK